MIPAFRHLLAENPTTQKLKSGFDKFSVTLFSAELFCTLLIWAFVGKPNNCRLIGIAMAKYDVFVVLSIVGLNQ